MKKVKMTFNEVTIISKPDYHSASSNFTTYIDCEKMEPVELTTRYWALRLPDGKGRVVNVTVKYPPEGSFFPGKELRYTFTVMEADDCDYKNLGFIVKG